MKYNNQLLDGKLNNIVNYSAIFIIVLFRDVYT